MAHELSQGVGATAAASSTVSSARVSHLDLNHAPYVLYRVKYIDLVSLRTGLAVYPCMCTVHAHPLLPFQASVVRLVTHALTCRVY